MDEETAMFIEGLKKNLTQNSPIYVKTCVRLADENARLQAERGGLRAALIRLGEGAYQSEIVDTEMEESERANPYFDKDEWINDWIAEQIELEGPDILSEWPYTRAGQQAESGGGEE
jgi:hypothetical protein